ncbi:hypothetical protein MKW98_029521 [Papaver atlanticum]|uniref:Uncharacterized protein n=1 Tax=Papaver atlanticum TaxID=357466 RepID=A0AAD4SHI8_9MAGN|nr:hypothetical protein MKW98_029521 [Papaver atlanticum]
MEESGPVNRCRCWGYFWRHMLDVIKIIFQVHLEPTSPWELLHKEMYGSPKYTGMMQALKTFLDKKVYRLRSFLMLDCSSALMRPLNAGPCGSSNQGSKLTSESLFSFQLFVCGFASGTCAKVVYHLMWSRRGSRLQGFLGTQFMG